MRTTYLISCLIALLAFSSCSIEEEEQTFDLTQKLVAHYAFDGNTKDASTFNVTAASNGVKLTHDRYANPRHAYYFDGNDDKIVIPANEHINFTNEFTINLWVKTDATHLQQVLYKNVADDKQLNAAYGISLGHTPKDQVQRATNDIIFSIAPFGTVQELRKFDYEKETWYMITCILKNDIMYLYINGRPAVLKYINGELATSALPLILGNDSTGENPFQGSIDDLRMYNEAKSLDFIEYLHKQ